MANRAQQHNTTTPQLTIQGMKERIENPTTTTTTTTTTSKINDCIGADRFRRRTIKRTINIRH
mgnify:CR=1 FL=1